MISLISLAIILGFSSGRLGITQGLPLQEVSAWVLLTLKTLATPLLFFSILDAFSKITIPWRKGLKLIGLSTMNAGVASLICLVMTELTANFFSEMSPQTFFLNGPAGNRILDSTQHTRSWLQPNLLQVALIALALGSLIRKFAAHQFILKKINQTLEVFIRILHGVVLVLPIAVFCTIAHLASTPGWADFEALGGLIAVVVGGLMLQLLCYYPFLIATLGKRSPFTFFINSKEALVTALGTGSSLATLPVTLRTLEKKLQISPQSARLVACVGTNLNHDGILLYEACAALSIAQLYGIHLNWVQKLQILCSSVIAAVGIAGVPEAGLITLSLVLSAAHLPTEMIPLLMSIDWLMGRLRATLNVASDLVIATLMDESNYQNSTRSVSRL